MQESRIEELLQRVRDDRRSLCASKEFGDVVQDLDTVHDGEIRYTLCIKVLQAAIDTSIEGEDQRNLCIVLGYVTEQRLMDALCTHGMQCQRDDHARLVLWCVLTLLHQSTPSLSVRPEMLAELVRRQLVSCPDDMAFVAFLRLFAIANDSAVHILESLSSDTVGQFQQFLKTKKDKSFKTDEHASTTSISESDSRHLLEQLLDLRNPTMTPDLVAFLSTPKAFALLIRFLSRSGAASSIQSMEGFSCRSEQQHHALHAEMQSESNSEEISHRRSFHCARLLCCSPNVKFTSSDVSMRWTSTVCRYHDELLVLLLEAYESHSAANLYHISIVFNHLLEQSWFVEGARDGVFRLEREISVMMEALVEPPVAETLRLLTLRFPSVFLRMDLVGLLVSKVADTETRPRLRSSVTSLVRLLFSRGMAQKGYASVVGASQLYAALNTALDALSRQVDSSTRLSLLSVVQWLSHHMPYSQGSPSLLSLERLRSVIEVLGSNNTDALAKEVASRILLQASVQSRALLHHFATNTQQTLAMLGTCLENDYHVWPVGRILLLLLNCKDRFTAAESLVELGIVRRMVLAAEVGKTVSSSTLGAFSRRWLREAHHVFEQHPSIVQLLDGAADGHWDDLQQFLESVEGYRQQWSRTQPVKTAPQVETPSNIKNVLSQLLQWSPFS